MCPILPHVSDGPPRSRLARILCPIFLLTFTGVASAQIDSDADKILLNRKLIEAVRAGSTEDATRLLKEGADVNSMRNRTFGILPIFVAVQNKDKDMVNFLLSYGAKPDDGLYAALDQDQVEILKILLDHHATVKVECPLNTGCSTPMHSAALGGRIKSIELLLQYGASINASDGLGRRPLHTIVLLRQSDFRNRKPLPAKTKMEFVQSLLGKGADPNLRDIRDKTALDFARLYEEEEIAALLKPVTTVPPDNDWHIEFAEAAGRSVEDLHRFLRLGVNPNQRAWDANFALHYAALSGKEENVKLLLDAGANINAIGERGHTPLYSAIDINNFSMVKLLVNMGADLTLQDASGATPLTFALEKKQLYQERINSGTLDPKAQPEIVRINNDIISLLETALSRSATHSARHNREPAHVADLYALLGAVVYKGRTFICAGEAQ